jgi:hypothetical protein
MLRVGDEEDVSTLETVSLNEEGFREDDLREWIINSPESILGEDFRLIGREVSVKQIGDGIDLLAIDRDANVVAIELKRGALKPKVDFQGLKYAAYTSHWDYSKLRDQFEKFKSTTWGKTLYEEETTFTEVLDEFCNEDYTLNQDQRIVFVGESVRERLDIVLRWLSDRSIDISVIEFQLLKDDDRLYLDAEQTIPTPEHTVTDVSPDTSDEPWKEDGQSWHLNDVPTSKQPICWRTSQLRCRNWSSSMGRSGGRSTTSHSTRAESVASRSGQSGRYSTLSYTMSIRRR